MHRLSPYKPSQPEETEMFNNFLQQERPTAASSRTATLDDATSIRSSGSYVGHLPSLLDLNNQNPIMPGYPVYPSIEGEPICDLLAGAHISGHPLYMDSHTHHRQGLGDDVTLTGYRVDGGTTCDELLGFEEGTLVPATVLACLLASRGCLYENVDDPAMCRASYSRAFGYEDDPRMHYDRRNYSNQMQSGMSDVCLQPHPHMSSYGNGFESHTAEKEYCPNNANTVVDYPYGAAMFNNELSLSLGTMQSNRICQPMAQDHHSEMSCSSVTINHDIGRGSEQSTPVETNDGSLSYASYRAPQPLSTLSASNYLLAVKQILADLSRCTLENVDLGTYSSCSPSNMTSNSGECSESGGRESRVATLSLQRQEVDAQKKQLKVLLKMADERYNQCLKEVHDVMSNFRPITGSDPEVHEHFVLQTTSFFYKSLKERISAQIHNMKAHLRSDSTTEQEGAFDSSFIHEQWALQQLRRKEHQLWRPQRGLPERSVSVLRAWMFQNFLRPYPKDSEKHMLAIKSGLTRSQVSNWFINARVRLWKPMIEEMYAEINRRKTHWKGHITDKSKRGDSSMGIQRFQRD